MLIQLDNYTTTMISGGSDSILPDYCSGFNGVGMGMIVAGGVAIAMMWAGAFLGGGCCCYRFNSAWDVEQTVKTGGGCCGGYLGRIAISRGAACFGGFIFLTIFASAAAGLLVAGGFLADSPAYGHWNCSGTHYDG